MRSMRKVVVILGPTAAGKTALSIRLAKTLGGEVISADSRQVYRGLDVGSGKITKREMRGIPHHLLSVSDPKRVFTANEYVKKGRAALEIIAKRGRVPIVAGGTGFYIDALLGNISLAEVPPNASLRKKLASLPLPRLQARLKKLDPKRYAEIDTKNPVRLIRALEIAAALGKTPRTKPEKIYETLFIGVTLPMPELKKKIHARLMKRANGIVRETRVLHTRGLSWKRMNELGLEYRYAVLYLTGKLPKKEMLAELEAQIVKYAKRQMTWFKRNKDIHWLKPGEATKAISLSKRFLSTTS